MSIAKLKGKQDRGQLGAGKSTVLRLNENESAIISIIADQNKEIIESAIHHKVHSANNKNTWADKTLTCWEEFGIPCPLCQMEKIVKHKQFVKSQSRCVIQFINFDSDNNSREKVAAIQRFVAAEGYFAGFIDTYDVELKDYIENVIDEKFFDEVNTIVKNEDIIALEQYKKLVAIVGEEHASHLMNPFNGLTFRFKMSGALPNSQYTFVKMREKAIATIMETKQDDIIILKDFWRKNSISDIEEITGLNLSDYLDITEFENYENEEAEAYE